MSNYSCVRIFHATLTANSADTVSLTSPTPLVEVLNRDASSPIYFRVDGVAPTVGGAECYVVLPGQALVVTPGSGVFEQVQLISAGAAAYSVTGVSS